MDARSGADSSEVPRERSCRVAWAWSFVLIPLVVWATVGWVLYPLRGASALPNPPIPAYTPEPPDLQDLMVLAPKVLATGSRAAMRVVVYDPQNGQPIAGTRLRVALVPRNVAPGVPPLGDGDHGASADPGVSIGLETAQVYAGSTDAQGTTNVQLAVPEGATGDWALVIDAAGKVGAQRLVHPVTVRRQLACDLSTDRATYMPGETMYIQVQASDATTGLPAAGEAITLTVADGRGNRICAAEVATSQYGLASGTCELATRVNEGEYRVTARVRDCAVERVAVVRAQPVAAFDLQIASAQPYGVYGEPVTVTVSASHWWGEPVVGAQVRLTGSLDETTDESMWRAVGETGEDGLFAVGLDIPRQTGSGYTQPSDLGRLHLTAQVAGGNEQAVKGGCWLPVSAQAIQISVAPEGSAIKPGIDNVIEIHTAYPDGRPAQAELTVDIPTSGQRVEMRSDAQGHGRFSYRPADLGETLIHGEPLTLTATARDAEGRGGAVETTLPVEGGDYHLLLRPDRASYRVGEQMHLEAWTSQGRSVQHIPQAVYVDIARGGQTVSAHSAPLSEGSATLDVELTDELSGRIELQGYVILPNSVLVRDVRQVWVEPGSGLQVTMTSDRGWYAPGEAARVQVAVFDLEGRGTQSAVSAFVAEERSGGRWACTTPSGEPLGASGDVAWGQLVGSGSDAVASLTDGGVPVWAQRALRSRPIPDELVQRLDAVDAVRASRRQVFSSLAERIAWTLVALSGLMGVTALVVAWRDQAFWPGLRTLAKCLFGGVIVLVVLAGISVLLASVGSALFGPGAIVVAGLGWLGGLLAWLVLSWNSCDSLAHAIWALLVGCLAVGIGLRHALAEGAQLSLPLIWAVLAALVVGALATYVCGTVLGRRHKRGGARIAAALMLLMLSTAAGALLMGRPNPLEGVLPGSVQLTQESGGARQTPVPTATVTTPQPTATVPLVATRAALLPPVPLHQIPKGGVRIVDAVTDPLGRLSAGFVAGQSGTFDLYAYAKTSAGETGNGGIRLQVRQAFSIDAEVPSAFTVGDQIDLPVALRNALPITQTVRFTVTPGSWFRVRSAAMGVQQVEVPGNRAVTSYVPLQITESGRQTVSLAAASDWGADSRSYSTYVLPDGMLVEWMYGGSVGEGHSLERLKFRVPWSAIRGTDRLTIALYTGWSGLLSTGLSGTLGKLDQQASGADDLSLSEAGATAMAAVLMDAGLRVTGASYAQQREAAYRALAQRYQRLLAFEGVENGFAAIRGGQADLYQTAYALLCLSRMSRAYPVDVAVIERTAHWLLDQQSGQGTWTASPLPMTWSDLPRPELPPTAYTAWALIDAGYAGEPQVQQAVEHLQRYLDKAQDPYTLALTLGALMTYGSEVEQEDSLILDAALARLAEMAEVTDGVAVWPGARETFSGAVSVGTQVGAADTERTALAVLALLRARTWTELATQGLKWLAENRDPRGTWRSPQATVLALDALSAAVDAGYAMPGAPAEPMIRVAVGESYTHTVHLTSPEMRVLVFDQLVKGYNDIELEAVGPGMAVYQALGTYYLPWDQVTLRPPEEEAIQIEVSYSSTSVAVGETITAGVGLRANRTGIVPLAVLELGLAPGLDPVVEDWDSLVASGVIAAYQQMPGQVRAYLSEIPGESDVRFEVRFRAQFPVVAKTQLTRAYDLANPRPISIRQPVEITVTEPVS